MSLRRRFGTNRGTSSLEFIAVFPFLLFIFLVGVELSRAWFTANVAQNAVREGARMGAVTPGPDANVASVATGRITAILHGAGLNAVVGPDVTCSPAPCAPDSEVQASVTVRFETAVPVFIPLLQRLDIKQTATMRYE